MATSIRRAGRFRGHHRRDEDMVSANCTQGVRPGKLTGDTVEAVVRETADDSVELNLPRRCPRHRVAALFGAHYVSGFVARSLSGSEPSARRVDEPGSDAARSADGSV